MASIRMIRHGEAAAGYAAHPDPGLSGTGRRQAEAVAGVLSFLGPLTIVSSPMARAQETAAPLAAIWQAEVAIEDAVSEIPSPGLSPAERGPWLGDLMARTWADTPPPVRRWRDDIATYLLSLTADTIVFSHFVAINAAIGVAIDAPTPRSRHLDHCSITAFDTSDGSLRLVELGDERSTTIL